MFLKFLYFEWLRNKRSPFWRKNILLNLLIGFFMLLMIGYLVLLGLFVGPILEEVFPDEDPLTVFNGFLIFYLFIALFIRFLMQSLPEINLDAYLHLPIRKRSIVHYMVLRTILHPINIIPLSLFVPVFLSLVIPSTTPLEAILWLITILCFVFGNNFLGTWLKRIFGSKPWIIFIALGIIGLLFLLEHLDLFSFARIGSVAMAGILTYPVWIIVPLAWIGICYFAHYQFLANNFYPEEITIRKRKEYDAHKPALLLRSLGITGTIIMLEMKLYWRHKRTRTIIYMLPLFLLYGFFFYPNETYLQQPYFLYFVGIFMTGGMMLNYTNYAFAYESNYFDALLTKRIDFKEYLRVKLIIAISIASICYILTIPYVFFGTEILIINSVMFLYNIGILSYLLLYMATFNKKRMDLSGSSMFNYQGMGAGNWLAIIPAFVLPVLIQIPFRIAGIPDAGLIFVAVLGILGLVLHKWIIGMIYQNLLSRKYIMSSAFREKD
jgi:hypothetical protein